MLIWSAWIQITRTLQCSRRSFWGEFWERGLAVESRVLGNCNMAFIPFDTAASRSFSRVIQDHLTSKDSKGSHFQKAVDIVNKMVHRRDECAQLWKQWLGPPEAVRIKGKHQDARLLHLPEVCRITRLSNLLTACTIEVQCSPHAENECHPYVVMQVMYWATSSRTSGLQGC